MKPMCERRRKQSVSLQCSFLLSIITRTKERRGRLRSSSFGRVITVVTTIHVVEFLLEWADKCERNVIFL